MNKLLNSVKSSVKTNNNKNDLVKKSITKQLSDSVKEIQYSSIEENKITKNADYMEAANTLCMTIEALFLHGLKDSLTHRFKRAIADVDERPEPNFWAPLLIISHKEIIDQITNLSQITTEVGQCRAWIRLALNDCLLSSYLMTLRQDPSALKSFYNVGAFIRDTELLEVSQRLIEGVETFKTFTLPCNSSLLNTWPLQSLFFAGIWAPTLKACPVAPCDDVAQALEADTASKPQHIPDTNSETCSLHSAMSLNSQTSGLRQIVALTEDEVLKIILEKDKNIKASPSRMNDDVKSSSSCSDVLEKSTEVENVNYNLGNSLNHRTGWSFDENFQENISTAEENLQFEVENNDVRKNSVNNESKSMEASYNALIESYNMLSGGFIKTPDIREVLQKFQDEQNTDVPIVKFNNNAKETITSNNLPIRSETVSLATQIGKIAHEKGLDKQNFKCMTCNQELNVFQNLNVCAFTGEYFCDSCMSIELISIPAKIIHNWDFKTYPVSQKSYNYINEIKNNPVIDFKTSNPYIYTIVDEMAQLQNLRNQLNFLRAYLYTCREPIIEELQKQMWPREYMYEHIHQYSISDLYEIQNGMLVKHLQKVVAFGKEHVFGCWLCSQKGFVCEICNKPKALFPFDVDNIYRCDVCNAVYHKGCLNASKPCPKCDRRKKREDLPLLGAITND